MTEMKFPIEVTSIEWLGDPGGETMTYDVIVKIGGYFGQPVDWRVYARDESGNVVFSAVVTISYYEP